MPDKGFQSDYHANFKNVIANFFGLVVKPNTVATSLCYELLKYFQECICVDPLPKRE